MAGDGDKQESYNYLCSYDNVTDGADEPELATNEEWRGIMVRARKDIGLSQQTLADKLGVSQPLISKIESGEVALSKLVLPICRLLGIPKPEHYVDDFEKNWSRAGRVLRHRNMPQAKRMLELMESMVADYEEQQKKDEDKPEGDPDKPRKPDAG
jgi:transcriptional regulator with XRE-family HTH domain